MYDGVALSQVHSKYLQVLGRVEFSPPPSLYAVFIDSVRLLVNYELQVLVLALASFSSVVCFMLTIYCLSLTHCMICKLCLISVRRKLQI